MAKLNRYLWLLLLQVMASKLAVHPSDAASALKSSILTQFLEPRSSNSNEASTWTHLLPINYYSELNQQYYVRFRRQSSLGLKALRRSRSYPFEYAQYN